MAREIPEGTRKEQQGMAEAAEGIPERATGMAEGIPKAAEGNPQGADQGESEGQRRRVAAFKELCKCKAGEGRPWFLRVGAKPDDPSCALGCELRLGRDP